eukprot:246998_1
MAQNNTEEKGDFDAIISSIHNDSELSTDLQLILSKDDVVESKNNIKKSSELDQVKSKCIEVNLYSCDFADPQKESVQHIVKLDGKNLIDIKLSHRVLKQVEAVEPTDYSIKITNTSTEDQIIGLFQVNPNNDADGWPLVWQQLLVPKDDWREFQWKIQWGLNYGIGPAPLTGGVEFKGGGKGINVSPVDSNNNGAEITYINAGDQSTWRMEKTAFPNLASGIIQTITDNSFENKLAREKNFMVSVTMDGKATFAMPAKPNKEYKFHTHPTYYLSTVATKVSTAITATVISKQSQAVIFINGFNSMQCEINDFNEFVNIRENKD